MHINSDSLQGSNHGSCSEQQEQKIIAACSGNEAFMELSEEDQERFWLITDALMMNDLEDIKRVHNLANYLMVKRIKDSAKVAEA